MTHTGVTGHGNVNLFSTHGNDLVRDGRFFEDSWGQGFHQDEGSVRHVCGWIHSKRRNKINQKIVEKLVRGHTNLVMREGLDDTLHHLLPGDIELIIDDPVDESEEESEVLRVYYFYSPCFSPD